MLIRSLRMILRPNLAICAAVVLFAATHATTPSPACSTSAALSQGKHDGELTFDNVKRTYEVLVQASSTEPKPLIYHFHGQGNSGSTALRDSGLGRVADANGDFHSVFPDGLTDISLPPGILALWILAGFFFAVCLLSSFAVCCRCRIVEARDAGTELMRSHDEEHRPEPNEPSAASRTGRCTPERKRHIPAIIFTASFIATLMVIAIHAIVFPITIAGSIVLGLRSWNANGTAGPGEYCAEDTIGRGDYCYDSCYQQNKCNDYGCGWTTCFDDLAFFDALYEQIGQTVCFDMDRIFMTGFSNGAILAYTLGMLHADRFAAVSSLAGSIVPGHRHMPAVPVPLLDLHGDVDVDVPANASESCPEVQPGVIRSAYGWYYTELDEILAFWQEANKCKSMETLEHWPTPFDGEDGLWCMKVGSNCSAPVVRCKFNGPHGYFSKYADLVWYFLSAQSPREG